MKTKRAPSALIGWLVVSAGITSWLAVCAGRAGARQDDQDPTSELAAVLDALRQGEAFFRDLDIEFTEEVRRVLKAHLLSKRNGLTKHSVRNTHAIHQGKYYYSETATNKDTPDLLGERDLRMDTAQVIAFDGEFTRLAQTCSEAYEKPGDGAVRRDLWMKVRQGPDEQQKPSGRGRIFRQKQEDACDFTPHRLGFWTDGHSVAESLDGTLFRRRAGQGPKYDYATHVRGEEVVDGLASVKIELSVTLTEMNKPPSQGSIVTWFALDRHYIPVRTWCTDSRVVAPNHPYATFEVSDWRQIEPGVWVPFRSVKTNFLTIDDKPEEAQQTVLTVKHMSRHPQYPLSKFQDVSLPAGYEGTVDRGDGVVQTFVQPETGLLKFPEDRPEGTLALGSASAVVSGWKRWILLGLAAAAVLAASVFVHHAWLLRRRTASKS
jgi:hypothetical protein